MKPNPQPYFGEKIQTLKFENATFAYEGQDPLFENMDLELPAGDVYCLRADNGAGRSSFLQLLGALQTPIHGSYYINGHNTTDMSFEEFLPFRLNIGYSFDLGGLLSNKSIFENLILPVMYHKMLNEEEAAERVRGYLDHFKISKYQHERPAHVPGSVRKTTVVLRSLILHPQLLLLDDPTVGLSQDATKQLVDLIYKLQDKGHLQTIVMSSYDDSFLARFNHRRLYIEGRQVLLEKLDDKVASL